MSDVSDIGDLLAKWRREKLFKLIWALGTAAATVVCTTATVSWQVRGYMSQLEHEADVLRGDLRVMAKSIEELQDAQKEDRRELKDVRKRADDALLYAQLAQRGKP